MEVVRFEHENKIHILESQILLNDQKLLKMEQEQQEVNRSLDEIEFVQENFLTQYAFNEFIKKQAREEKYGHHLGLISLIRKDFETLSDLFVVEHHSEGESPEQKRKVDEQIDFGKNFNNESSLDRIILYIDDLDRCSDEKVLEVIQGSAFVDGLSLI